MKFDAAGAAKQYYMKKIMILTAAATLAACSSNQPKALVLYYSQTGATKAVAETIAGSLGADIESIELSQPYDGDFQQTIERCLTEKKDGVLPAVNPLSSDLSKYDVIFLGFPVWFGVAAPPVLSLAESMSFEGKKVVTFCTFGSGGLETGTENLRGRLKGAEVVEGYGVRNARIAKAPAEIETFLVNAGFKEGEVSVLPEFSEVRDVTDADTVVFNAACGSYQMPLGEPLSVAERPVPGGVEYAFTAVTTDKDGQPAKNRIYVLALDGEAPEFTKVLR